jgi:aldose 1-epimerase
VSAPSGRQFELAHAGQRAVAVEIGGGLRSYSSGGLELLDGYAADEACSSARGQVLIPWPNRIEDGSYEFDGRRHELPLTEPERRNAIHGLVRWSVWDAVELEADRVVLEHALRPQPGYPFSLSLRLEYTLSDRGLRVRTTAANTGAEACPYGAGAHPYLTVGTESVDSAVLQVPAGTVLEPDERGLPTGSAPVEGTEYDFREARPVASTRLDHCLTDLERGEDGLARVTLSQPEGGAGITLWMDGAYSHLMLFTGDPLPDVDRRSLAVEPMTCPPNAFRTGERVIRLEPGESCAAEWGLEAGA